MSTTQSRLGAETAPLSDVDVERLADEAEQGYDVEELLQRRRGRPSMGSSAASVESVRLDPELKRDLILRAAQEGTSVSDLIRSAVREYLRAGPEALSIARASRNIQ